MSDETVEVNTRLDSPPNGYGLWKQWTPDMGPRPQGDIAVAIAHFVAIRVAPPERMVTLTLPESVVGKWATGLWDTSTAGVVADAARKALAEAPVCEVPSHVQPCSIDSGGRHWLAQEAQEACGVLLRHTPTQAQLWTPVLIENGMVLRARAEADAECALPKGHEGSHRP